ncbi:MAG: nucleotidyltransferase domain-containing protein [Leptolyngbya sp. Prado105]|jgi:predicted nucleotidyltransferase|nr:nucleotidyltransferase domain-containing protein [Leptolyngbya sp. Prado105]
MRHPQLDEILARLRSYLEETYGDRLSQVILYGSQARGDAHEESDIDVLVVLKDSFDFCTEVDLTNHFIADLCLDCEVVVSVMFAKLQKVESSGMPFYRNVRHEGIAV